MNTKHLASVLLFLPVLAIQTALAQPDAKLLPPIQEEVFVQPGGKDQPKQPAKDKDKDKKPIEKKVTDPPDTDAFTQTPAPISEALGYNPQMLGDFFGHFAASTSMVTGTCIIRTDTTIIPAKGQSIETTKTTTGQVTQARPFRIPVANYSAFKVAENASPMPIDRVFFTYNFYSDLRASGADQNGPITNTQRFTNRIPNGFVDTTVTTIFPAAPAPYVNLHREVFGFEKTFLDGQASIEVRLPIYQQPSDFDGFRAENIGDLTIVSKYAFYLNRTTGDVVSGGLAITAPTGPSIQTFDGALHSTLFQPWVGYIWNMDRLYVHAFHSAVFPTDPRDVTLLFNDVGLGYRLNIGAPDRAILFVVPTVEAHITTPLSNRGPNEPISVPDLVVLTGGVHVGIFRNSTLSIGVGAPITGPRIYGMEAFMQFNRRF